ncbi:MAG: alpha/beta hydrolase [Chloroflexi bacterium]|nr:alpha/beta hydrolase [Chloroflexota bacterium]
MNTNENRDHINFISHGSGPPAILIHGIGASLHQWDSLIPALVAGGFSAHALDLQGHGDSAKPKEIHKYHIETYYTQLEKWLDDLELSGPLLLVGHSMGAYLSLLYTLHHPDKVHALVLADPFYNPKQLSPLLRLAMRRPNPGVKILDALPAQTFEIILGWTEKTNRSVPASIRRRLSADFKRATPRILYTTRTTRDLTTLVPRIEIPTLVMWGAKDLTLAPASFPRLVETLPQAIGYTFHQCGHIPHLTQASNFNRRVIDFAAGVSKSGSGKPTLLPPDGRAL